MTIPIQLQGQNPDPDKVLKDGGILEKGGVPDSDAVQRWANQSEPDATPLGVIVNAAHFVLNTSGTVEAPFTNCFLYLVQVKLGGTVDAALVHLIHDKHLDVRALQAMIDEAKKLTEDRIIERRRNAKIPAGTNRDKLNMECFALDVAWFEVVMCDKFNFRKMIMISNRIEVIPTVVTPVTPVTPTP